jgi:SAM-dependent methyltransferase
MLALAKDRMAQQRRTNIDFLCADLNDLPLLPASFDFVGSNCVLHDTPVAEALENLRRLVRPGGRLLVRDLVTRNPARATSPAWQVLRTFKQVPRYLRNFGLGDTLRLVSFEVRPAWVRHKCEGANPTPAALRSIFTRVLPGCTFADYGWALAAYWQAPPDRL